MKKGLSILLIAAALFGFYGGAVNLNDVLACKDYWEEAGKKSTADMNKLEDGLKQLQENEQAYLDGKDQLAEGEKALADGEAQYAQGLADYAAAPGKLAAGEAALAEGEDSYADLKKLISGLKTARQHGVKSTKKHDKYWHDAFSNALEPGRKKIEGITSSDQYAGLLGLIDKLNKQQPGTIAKRFSNKSQSYANFDKQVVTTKKDFENAAKTLENYRDALFQLAEPAAGVMQLAMLAQEDPATYGAKYMTAKSNFEAAAAKFDDPQAYGPLNDAVPNLPGLDDETKQSVTLLMTAIAQSAAGNSGGDSPVPNPQTGGETNVPWFGIIASGLSGDNGAKIKGTVNKYVNMLDYDDPSDKNDGYAQQFGTWDDGYNTLAKGQADLGSTSDGIPFAFKNMTTNKTIKAAIKKYDKKLMKQLKKYQGTRLKSEDMDDFDDDITYLSKNVIPRALKVLAKVKGSAESQLADGRRQLAQGRADYAAAPGKLADAERQLADGRAQLAAGKEQLAQYEDGEQQVRDGLATLVGTEPDLELEGILDRLNGDGDFDNGDDHLDIEEGLNAVDVGRGYQADDGVLITDEIMARAVGTGALLGAGVLAVLAAILSFLKKNKGAGVLAILAAAAGAFGAYYGSNAGTYFSDIAGSTAGNAAWVAAGILGAVALVHSIVHFAAKKAA